MRAGILLFVTSTCAIGAIACGTADDAKPSKSNEVVAGKKAPAKTTTTPQLGQSVIPPSTDGCSEDAKVPYMLSRAGDLYRFNPQVLKVDKMGHLGCAMDAANDETPISMAIDRSGTAWISTTIGKLLKVDVRTAACTRVTNFASADFGWHAFGMGFSVKAAGGSDESLFISELTDDPSARPSLGLGSLDVTAASSPKLKAIGEYNDDFGGASAELTGTGDGRLFAFFVQDHIKHETATIVQVDKANGNILETVPLKLKAEFGYAFSFWGGDFWVYSSMPGVEVGSTQITRVKYASDKSESVAVSPMGFDVIGAGVSTCAPTAPVN